MLETWSVLALEPSSAAECVAWCPPPAGPVKCSELCVLFPARDLAAFALEVVPLYLMRSAHETVV